MKKNSQRRIIRVHRPFLVALVLGAAVVGAGAIGGSPSVAAPATYYVSPLGDNADSGAIDSPWRTLTHAADRLAAGDVLYLRGGIYQEKVKFRSSGTAAQPIKILAYPGERPIIDGRSHTLPAPTPRYSQLVTFAGSHIEASGIEVRNSYWAGVVIKGSHVTVSEVVSHDNMEAGILTWGSTDSVVQDSISYNNAKSHEHGVHKYGRTTYSTGISAGRGSNGTILRRNTVYANWGEGLSTYNATNTLMEDNVVYDNAKQVYISDTTGTTVRRNLVYCTPGNAHRLPTTVRQHGINLQDENQRPASADIVIVNNLVAGCVSNFKWYPFTTNSSMQNVLVANNTFLDATGAAPDAAVRIAAPRDIPHAGTRIVNNIIVQDDGPAIGSLGPPADGVTLSHNLWSQAPPTSLRGTGAVVGDPLVARTGTLAPGALTGEYFMIGAGSPARDAAAGLPDVPADYFGTPRPVGAAPDLGAHEHDPGPAGDR